MPLETHPAHSAERQAIREKRGLRPLRADELGWPVERLPGGIYGFTTSAATSEVPLFDKPVFRCFEVHKLADGEVHYVGYIPDGHLAALEAGSEPLSIVLYPDPYEQATHMVTVPDCRIDRKRPPLRDSGSPMALDLAPQP